MKKKFKNSSIIELQNKVKNIFNSRKVLSYYISSTCIYLINNTFLKSENNRRWNQIILTYLKKLILNYPINKGGFMSFDN